MKYCFDIDGTLCTTNCHYKDAKPFTNVIDKVNKLYEDGHEITLFTSRGSGSGTDWFEFTKKQVDSWSIKYHKLILGKPQYDIFVDDRAINNLEWYKQNNLEINE
tara:strand:- start:738 stop:1052 length:315 start_codon:yes stop_codon:yes gene_type:complete